MQDESGQSAAINHVNMSRHLISCGVTRISWTGGKRERHQKLQFMQRLLQFKTNQFEKNCLWKLHPSYHLHWSLIKDSKHSFYHYVKIVFLYRQESKDQSTWNFAIEIKTFEMFPKLFNIYYPSSIYVYYNDWYIINFFIEIRGKSNRWLLSMIPNEAGQCFLQSKFKQTGQAKASFLLTLPTSMTSEVRSFKYLLSEDAAALIECQKTQL